MSDSGWVSVDDRLPVDVRSVKAFEAIEILIVSDSVTQFCEFTCGPLPEPWYKFDDYHEAFITHWQPLPKPPQ